MMAQSPSSLKLYAECPWRYMGRYLEGWYRFEGNEYTRRGTEIHALMEDEAHGRKAYWPPREAEARDFGLEVLRSLDLPGLRKRGWKVTPELETAVDGAGEPVPWNDRGAFLRCRIDLCLRSPDGTRTVIVDWKTGKTPGDAMQLHMNALTLPGAPGGRFTLLFAYLDGRKIERMQCGVPDLKFPVDVTEETRALAGRSPMRRVWESLMDCMDSHRTGVFPKKRDGDGCRWCEIKARCGSRPERRE
jgi:RecB family exonuclease